jgi:hypothetical protein
MQAQDMTIRMFAMEKVLPMAGTSCSCTSCLHEKDGFHIPLNRVGLKLIQNGGR